MRTNTTALQDQQRREALAAVRTTGCPICLAGNQAQRQWINYYVLENYTDATTQAKVYAARGFCGAHTRALLAQPQGPHVATTTYAGIVHAVLTAPDPTAEPTQRCPTCIMVAEAQHRRADLIGQWWTDHQVHAALKDQARLCVAHVPVVLEACALPSLPTVTREVRDRLADAEATDAVAMLTGQASDHDLRRERVTALASELTRRETHALAEDPGTELRADLTHRTCPSCLAAGVAAARYLAWLRAMPRFEVSRLDAFDVPLCPDHLADLSMLDLDAGTRIALRHRELIVALLDRLIDQLAVLPPPGLVARWPVAWRAWKALTGLPRTRRERATAALSALRGPARPAALALANYRRRQPRCAACQTSAIAAARRNALIAALLGDSGFRADFENSHGLCLRHTREVTETRHDNAATHLLCTRLAVLRWQLDETERKQAWRTRHEPRGTEQHAWRHAPTWLQPDTDLGTEPPPEQASK